MLVSQFFDFFRTVLVVLMLVSKSLTRQPDVTHGCKRFGKKQRKAPLKRTAFQRAFHVYSVNPLHSVSLGG